MSTFTNKWLNPSCPSVDEFFVDKSKQDYYIQYYETKSMVSNLNNDWKLVKKYIDELKNNIREVNSAIDSEDYKSKTNEVIAALDSSMVALDSNYSKLFNSVVKRMEDSAESDEWFSETASLYAGYIATAILGKESGNNNGNLEGTNLQVMNDTSLQYGPQTPSRANYNGGSGNGGSSANSESTVQNDAPSLASANPINSTGNGSSATEGIDATLAQGEQASNQEFGELQATNVQYSATPSNGNIDTSKYRNKPESGFVVTTDNPKYNLSESDIELLTAIVSAESDKSYDDALAVASTIFNRCEEPKWASCGGNNPVKQATAPNQFVVYQHGSYKKYMGNGAPDTCRQAVLDVINGARNHDYLSFRSNGSTKFGGNMITSSGNRYK